jgi:hypothetical protein
VCHEQPGSRDYGELPAAIDGRSSARSALKKSCYFRIDFKISEDATVFEAVQRFAAYNIGALAVSCRSCDTVALYCLYVSSTTACYMQQRDAVAYSSHMF